MAARTRIQMIPVPTPQNDEESHFAEQRHAALGYVNEAFEEGRLDGIEAEYIAHAALFTALKELVLLYGEEAVAGFAERLPERLLQGEFSVELTRQ